MEVGSGEGHGVRRVCRDGDSLDGPFARVLREEFAARESLFRV
jgi:hypothetical protein